VGDDVFQIDELVDAYWVALSTDLEENLNFSVTENIFIDVVVKKSNDVFYRSQWRWWCRRISIQ
jgi:hypothetical protein